MIGEHRAAAAPNAALRAPQRGRRLMATTFVGLLSAEAIMRLLALVAAVVIVRSLSPQGFGEYSYALAFVGIVGVLIDFGVSQLLIRDVSAQPEHSARLLSAALAALALLAGVALAIVAVLVLTGAVTHAATETAMLIAFAAAVVDASSMAFEATLVGRGRARILPVVRGARGGALLAAVVVVAAAGPTPELFLLAVLGSSLANAGVAAAACMHAGARPRFENTVRGASQLLRRAVPFALLAGTYVLYARIDLVMLGMIRGAHATGQYGAAVRTVETALLIPFFFGSAFLATVSQVLDGRRTTPATPERIAAAVRIGLLLCVPVSFVLAVAGPAVVRFVAGDRYAAAGELVIRLSPVVALVACYGVLANLQLARGQVMQLVRIVAIGAVVKVAADAVLIPSAGARGAAATVVGVELMIVLLQWRGARVELRGLAMWWLRFGSATAAMLATALCLARGVGTSWPVTLTLGLAVFAVATWATRAVTRQDLRIAELLLSRGRITRVADPR